MNVCGVQESSAMRGYVHVCVFMRDYVRHVVVNVCVHLKMRACMIQVQ